ncbi:MAG TPA: phosphate ABC transporter ATP-binding protein [Clostridia bacterium]|nr:phosphate ABC transporter ATP-binding protein [Clostridia bacterium]
MSDYKIRTENLSLFYGDYKALDNVSLRIKKKNVTVLAGPTGSGKTSLLETFNRMVEMEENAQVRGNIYLDDTDIYTIDIALLRRCIGMIYRRPNPFPKSIYENIAFGPRIHGMHDREFINEIVERSLREVGLWKEVKERLSKPAFGLSEGQQQLLCLARLLAVNPDVVMFDESISVLEPSYVQKFEELIQRLKEKYTFLVVTSNIQQAARISDDIAILLFGELVEFGNTGDVFTTPEDRRTEDFISGRLG